MGKMTFNCARFVIRIVVCMLVLRLTCAEDPDAQQFLYEFNTTAVDKAYESSVLAWAYNTNVTDYNAQKMVEYDGIYANFTKEAAKNASTFDLDRVDNVTRRRLEKIGDQGVDAMKDPKKLEMYSTVLSEMEGIYAKGRVCGIPPDNEKCYPLEPDLTRMLAEDRDYFKLSVIWKGWRDAVAKGEMKKLYEEFVELSNEGVRDGGYNDTGDYWRSWYESETFEADLQALLEELKPLYRNLHTYVRRKLQEQYPNNTFPSSGHIPAHILGNMWAQSWINIYDLVTPFKGQKGIDITPVLKERNYTAMKMFKVAEGFFTSLGLKPMPEEFWKNSMIERPTDGREVVCHASAWDFMKGNDVRIKMCTDITMDDLVTIHHEMGHIQYYLQYHDQPFVFREGANPGFHEAIGDVMALSASTPGHLHAIGLLNETDNTHETDINFLMRQALDKVAFLPFGYLIDQWRWSVFRGDTTPDQYTEDWWKLRCKYQGISPPVRRTTEDFDAGAKYHVAANTPYIRYFVSFVIQFQFHKALCEAANQTGPLHKCDIYNSKEAGKKLEKLLQAGSSKPWEDIMEEMTGSRNMSTEPLKEYFKPLMDWLEKQNKGEPNQTWTEECPKFDDLDLEEKLASHWLEVYNIEASKMMNKATISQWNYGANITDYNQEVMVNTSLEKSDFDKKMAKEANYFPWKTYNNVTMKRLFSKITDIGTNALEDKDQLKQMTDLQAMIEGIYGKGKVQMSNGKTLLLEPGLTEIMAKSRNYTELKEAWVKWRDVTGPHMKDDYEKFVSLSNKAVRELNYKDTGDFWRSAYESNTFQDNLKGLLEKLKPLYKLLHGYVRKQLIKTYGAENFPRSGHIPAHLLGNMWGQQWNNIYDLVEPYKGVEKIDVTPAMIKQNYTVMRMFRTAENFFKSLDLSAMPEMFWNKTIMVNPPGIQMVCHASAWDFYDQKDFRIKMCTDVNMEELIVIHHEMGHIQYFLQYKDQPVKFREGANPGFHEAIGDVMALSVSTPKHLHTIGLLDSVQHNKESDINFLMKMALEKIAFLPFGYLIDQWRWSVFSGETPPEKYNDKWWDLRCKYQGLSPPVERKESDFDPGAKYHIPANVPYIRYFVSYVLQFQFHKALCDKAGHTGPLRECDIYRSKRAGALLRYFVSFVVQFHFHQALCKEAGFTGHLYECDIYNSTLAGHKLRDLLKLGSSLPWPDALEKLTGSRQMSVDPLMEYFKPLMVWLKQNVDESEQGWDDDHCSHVTEGDQLNGWLKQYEREASKHYYEQSLVDWAFNTNITEETQKASTAKALEYSAYAKEVARNVSQYNWHQYRNESLKRQLKKMADIGTSALKNEQQLKLLTDTKSKMEAMYSTGEVCDSAGSCLRLDPGLTKIMAESRDYSTLLHAWQGWRNATGRRMPQLYATFVNLSNTAIKELGYSDTGEYWRSFYESSTFENDLQDLLKQLQPLYQNLHTYVRNKLIKLYGEENFPESGHIPAHLLGNMWAQSWDNLYDFLIPYKGKTNVDISPALQEQHFNATRMFKTAEEFFTSLGLEPMLPNFWKYSMLVRPEDREVVCHASAWDFTNNEDFRIKMCTKVNMEDLITIHHEMGHTEYQMQYRHQPLPFRDGANPGFHEAIGDVMSLSVSTPKHLRKIKLLQDGTDDKESEINFLMKMALDKIAFLPFGYLIDQWRWSVFSGETTPDRYNEKWWELRCKYQGVSPPVKREAADFDPGAKFHIPGNYPYIRYFVSYVIQFQFHKALCEAANQTGPLHRCDIYQSKEAGNKLKKLLSMGASRPWPEAMEVITGQRKMDVGPVLEYFTPLIEFLEEENKNQRPGWSPACPPDSALKAKRPVPPPQAPCGSSDTNGASLNRFTALTLFFVIWIKLFYF